MVVINELRITPDGKRLILDASIENLVYYKDVNIAAVIIDSQDTYTPSGPSNRAFFHQSYEEGVEELDLQGYGTKHIRVCLSAKELGVNLDNNLFFVYIVTSGAPAMDTPCGMDNIYTMGIVYNTLPIYNLGMNYVRELADNCSVPRNFIDYILRFKAFELSLRTGNYTLAIEYWKKFFKNRTSSISEPKGCGCHGSY